MKTFWHADKKYLADYVDGEYKDWTVRPNMIFATSFPFSPVDEEMRKLILSRVRQELLTPRGIRTLTPKSPVYKGAYIGSRPRNGTWRITRERSGPGCLDISPKGT